MAAHEEILDTLEDALQSAAFMVGSGANAKDIHREILNALVLVTQLRSNSSSASRSSTDSDITANEVNKVKRRLNLWARRKDQINSRILMAYLTLEKSGKKKITESMLKELLGPECPFDSNFIQMRTIADRNHGKVFDQQGETVTLWAPVESAVRDFEKAVLDS